MAIVLTLTIDAHSRWFYISLHLLIFSVLCSAAFAEDVVSTNITVNNTPGEVITDNSIARFNGNNAVATVTDLGLPPESDISSLHYIDENTLLFTLKTKTQLGSFVATAGDVLHWNEGVISVLASRAELGLGPATKIDALTKNGEALIFSTNIADVINGISISNSDLLTWTSGGNTQLLQAQNACGIPPETNLTGVHRMKSGEFLMVFTSAAQVGGVMLRKGDLARCNPVGGSVVLHKRFSDLGANWAAVGLDAISSIDGELIFVDGFENSNL